MSKIHSLFLNEFYFVLYKVQNFKNVNGKLLKSKKNGKQ